MTSTVFVRTIIQTKSCLLKAPAHFRVCGKLHTQQRCLVASKAEATLKSHKEGNAEKHAETSQQENLKTSNVQLHKDVAPLTELPPIGVNTLPHPIWTQEELQNVTITHKPPEGFVDKAAYYSVQTMRKSFDVISGFSWGRRTEKKWLKRIIFLETVAGVPGMVAAMTRHLHSLRRMQRDYGWIHTLLEEAENERMHLLTALQLKQPTRLFRAGVIISQGVFVTMFSFSYLISPKFCHRFVGYLEEEAVKTYTKCLKDIDTGPMQHWKTQSAPDVAKSYWKMPEDTTMQGVILVIRADEAHHRLVNHTLASMKETDYNPYGPGK